MKGSGFLGEGGWEGCSGNMVIHGNLSCNTSVGNLSCNTSVGNI